MKKKRIDKYIIAILSGDLKPAEAARGYSGKSNYRAPFYSAAFLRLLELNRQGKLDITV